MHFKVPNRPRDSLRDSISLVERLDEMEEEKREKQEENKTVSDYFSSNITIHKVFIAYPNFRVLHKLV